MSGRLRPTREREVSDMAGRNRVRTRFWIEAGLAVSALAILIVTIVWHDWIEIAFGVDPDAGSGALEWAITATLVAAAVVNSLAARFEWRRARRQAA
jgi:hypothetical protein